MPTENHPEADQAQRDHSSALAPVDQMLTSSLQLLQASIDLGSVGSLVQTSLKCVLLKTRKSSGVWVHPSAILLTDLPLCEDLQACSRLKTAKRQRPN